MKKIISAFMAISVIFILVSCGTAADSKLIGKWQYEIDMADMLGISLDDIGLEGFDKDSLKMTIIYDFKEDGTVDMITKSSVGSETTSGKYIAEDGKLYLSDEDSGTVIMSRWLVYSVDSNTLTIEKQEPADEEMDEFLGNMYPMVFTKVTD